MKRNRWIIGLALVAALSVLVIYFVPGRNARQGGTEVSSKTVKSDSALRPDESLTVKIFFPDGLGIRMEQRVIERVFSQKKVLKGALSEFLKGPTESGRNIIPADTVLLGVFVGNDGITYIDFSEDLRRNFHGDIADEFLFLKSIYETVIANSKADDVKILVDNKEIDTIGGHFPADRPLKQLVTQEIRFD